MISLFSWLVTLSVISGVLSTIVIFGDLPTFRNTPLQRARSAILSVGKLYRFLNERYFKERLSSYMGYFVPLGYLAVVTFCIQQFLKKTLTILFTINNSKLMTYYIAFTIALVYVATILAVFSDPGRVTSNSDTSHFKNNQLIFFDHKVCSTCHITKPARSKHCSTCGHCYMLFDHHCVWVNNCIGYYNYRWFLLFLVANINFLAYGDYLCWKVISSQKVRWGKSFWMLIRTTNDVNRITGIFVLLCSIFFCITVLFTGLHLRYIYLGVTTNELDKWSDVEYLVTLGSLYHIENGFIDNESYVEKVILQSREEVFISLKNNEILINRDNLPRFDLRKVESVERDLINIYDRGFWNNLMERLFPQ
ncbi:Heme Binding Zinc finger protein [Scheffersomyces stipitis CBS 6054]|uniref:Palmitoyltransferase n=1 Tax=Scheffersomyces stipitis (strain ATCC 58785 / CBS 6054 / NBRC 10063 / NRRL Y-11545) TaxID=322104 RepID=A3LXR6_PICST|nr:Heme Binding Zinc finger protein [Scheffersomyces stipitis CBS 6054]ABN67846.2 Heme Binding Zinc finger protein [Scheffersomyces stipitis CBS 6054]